MPFNGIGKPERLRYHKNPTLYSRRIDQQHRLVYSVSSSTVTVIACGGMVQSGRPLKQEPTEMIQARLGM